MSAQLIDRPEVTALASTTNPTRRPTPSSPVRSRRAVSPRARPSRPSSGSGRFVVAGSPARVGVRSCAVVRPPAGPHLTERGLTLVLVLAALIAVAAVTVVALTAVRVTGPNYREARPTPSGVVVADA